VPGLHRCAKNRPNWATPEGHVVVGTNRSSPRRRRWELSKDSKRIYDAYQINVANTEFR
jgi:hypothetical protein